MRYAPDQEDPFPVMQDGEARGDGKGRNRRGGSFMPGQISGLANDLATQSGTTVQENKKYLRGLYSPVTFGGFTYGNRGGGKGNGGGHDGGQGNGGGNNQSNDGGPSGFTPSSPRNKMAMDAPMTFPLGLQSQMGMQQPMMAQQQAQQVPGQRPLTPEMIDYIRTSMMRG